MINTVEDKPFDINSLSKLKRDFLKRKSCFLCEVRLSDINICGSYDHKHICSQKTRNQRVKTVLSTYKTRKNRVK